MLNVTGSNFHYSVYRSSTAWRRLAKNTARLLLLLRYPGKGNVEEETSCGM